MTLRHIVLLKFPGDLSTSDDARLRAMVAGFPEAIALTSQCRIDRDLTGERSQGFQYLLFTEFPDSDALAAYAAHPVHQEFVAFLEAHRCSRLAFDYYVE